VSSTPHSLLTDIAWLTPLTPRSHQTSHDENTQYAAHAALDDLVQRGAVTTRSAIQSCAQEKPRASVVRTMQAQKVGILDGHQMDGS
jgi:hypothetical protein